MVFTTDTSGGKLPESRTWDFGEAQETAFVCDIDSGHHNLYTLLTELGLLEGYSPIGVYGMSGDGRSSHSHVLIRGQLAHAMPFVASLRAIAMFLQISRRPSFRDGQAGRRRSVGEIREHAVDAEPLELQVLVHRGAVGRRLLLKLRPVDHPRLFGPVDSNYAADRIDSRG